MYTPRTYGGAPAYSMPPVTPGEDVVHDGLGFWGALIPIATTVVGGLVGGGGDSIDKRTYYEGAKSSIWCPERSAAPLDVVERAIANLGPSAQLRQEVASQLASDSTWEELRIARPRGPRQEAAVLTNWGNGWRYCPRGEAPGGADLRARNLVGRLLANEAGRQRTLAEQARAAAAAAAARAQTIAGAAPIVAGVPNVALVGGAAVVAFLLLRRR